MTPLYVGEITKILLRSSRLIILQRRYSNPSGRALEIIGAPLVRTRSTYCTSTLLSTTISGGPTHYLCSTMVRLPLEVGQETLLGLRSAVGGREKLCDVVISHLSWRSLVYCLLALSLTGSLPRRNHNGPIFGHVATIQLRNWAPPSFHPPRRQSSHAGFFCAHRNLRLRYS